MSLHSPSTTRVATVHRSVALRIVFCLPIFLATTCSAGLSNGEPVSFRHIVVDAAGPENMHVKTTGDINGDGFVDLTFTSREQHRPAGGTVRAPY